MLSLTETWYCRLYGLWAHIPLFTSCRCLLPLPHAEERCESSLVCHHLSLSHPATIYHSRQPTLWLTPSTAENLPSPKLKLALPPPELWWALAVSVNPGTEIHIWGGASNWHRTRKFFVDRECEEFIGCPPGRGIRAGISGSDRMLLGPKATEAASNKVNWGTHRLRWLLGIRTFDLSSLEAIIQLLLHTLFLYLCGIFSIQISLCLAS